MIYFYKAFGLTIKSEIESIILSPIGKVDEPDVSISKGDLSAYSENDDLVSRERTLITIKNVGRFLIQNGINIIIDAETNTPDGLLAVYLLGSCMGALLYQRGLFLLHGSCVCRDGKAILLIGETEAGKSTIAATFLKHGWSMLTDDVAIVKGIDEKKPTVFSSYPSQKLWEDSIDILDYHGKRIPLYQEERKEKYHTGVESFLDGWCDLRLICRLFSNKLPPLSEKLSGIAEIDQLVRNTYRYYLIPEENRQQHFQRCVSLASAVPMIAVGRDKKEVSPEETYRLICSEREKLL